jgi:hypothetical protein
MLDGLDHTNFYSYGVLSSPLTVIHIYHHLHCFLTLSRCYCTYYLTYSYLLLLCDTHSNAFAITFQVLWTIQQSLLNYCYIIRLVDATQLWLHIPDGLASPRTHCQMLKSF